MGLAHGRLDAARFSNGTRDYPLCNVFPWKNLWRTIAVSSRICRNGSERSKALTFRGLRDESGNERGTAGTTMMGRMADRGREKDSEPENESKTKGKPNNLVFPLRDRRDGGNNGRPGVRLRSEVEENWIRNRIYSILFARDDENLNSSGTRLSIFLYLSIYLSIYPSLSLSDERGDVSPFIWIFHDVLPFFSVRARFVERNRQRSRMNQSWFSRETRSLRTRGKITARKRSDIRVRNRRWSAALTNVMLPSYGLIDLLNAAIHDLYPLLISTYRNTHENSIKKG